MGYLEIIPDWDTCDKCARRIAIAEGTYTDLDGLKIVFTCRVCK